MQERDDIDGLFKSGLENFKPDASHLSYGPLASAIAAKTTVAGTAAVAKTGFFAKWGITMYIGLTTAVAGTGVAIVYAPDQVAVEANSKTILAASIQVKEELQLLAELPVTDSVMVDDQEMIVSEESIRSSAELSQSNEAKQLLTNEKSVFKSAVTTRQKETTSSKKQTKQQLLTADEAKTIAVHEKHLQPDLVTETIDLKARTIQSNVVAKSITGLPLKNKKSVLPKTLQPLSNSTDSLSKATELFAAKANELHDLQLRDSSEKIVALQIEKPRIVWPQNKFSLKAGLGYAPLKTELIENENDGITDTIPFIAYYYFGDKVILRPSINNELAINFSYQKRLKNNLQLGGGIGYLQGGWDAFVDYTQEYWIDNGFGTLVYMSDTSRIGEYNFDYRSYTLNLYSGYDFVFSEKLMVSTSFGIGLNQVFMTKDYRSYQSNSVTRLNRSDFVVNGFGAADLIYRINSIGFSVGASINGRTNLGNTIDAKDFHNSVSFGLNAGIHYFITDRIH